MAVASHMYASFYTSIANISSGRTTAIPRVSFPSSSKFGYSFASGAPLPTQSISLQRKPVSKGASVSIRCEQNTNEGTGLDVWLGRIAMVGFVAAISVEIGTGKGLLENFGLTSPLPTVALGVTVLVGVLTAIFIFLSASDK
uniref:Stress enhanced protein 1 n=1 Tax=Kalanchoe fedtschenkoi TaxID=63787 RepID=A0A7N0T0S8_KALFE